jgi:hypothetical protein
LPHARAARPCGRDRAEAETEDAQEPGRIPCRHGHRPHLAVAVAVLNGLTLLLATAALWLGR